MSPTSPQTVLPTDIPMPIANGSGSAILAHQGLSSTSERPLCSQPPSTASEGTETRSPRGCWWTGCGPEAMLMVLASSPPMVATTPRCSPVDCVRTGDREVGTLQTLKSAASGCGRSWLKSPLKNGKLAIPRTVPEWLCMYHVRKKYGQCGKKSCTRPGRVARTDSGDLRPGRWPRETDSASRASKPPSC